MCVCVRMLNNYGAMENHIILSEKNINVSKQATMGARHMCAMRYAIQTI